MVVCSKLSQVFTYESWMHAVSGAAGGCIAMSTFYPLDTVRSRLQLEDPNRNGEARSTLKVIKEIILSEGYQSLYRGLGPVLQSLCISNFVYFYSFHTLKALSGPSGQKQHSALKDLFLGAIAGVINVFLTTPFWVANTKCRMRNVSSISDEENKFFEGLFCSLLYIAKTEGMKGLWSGTIPSLILVSNPSLQFMMYEFLKRRMANISGHEQEISSFGYFAIGAAAKAFATVLTYPIQLVQTKLRHHSRSKYAPSTSHNVEKEIGVIQMILDIIQNQGLKGLFRGMEAKILQTVLTAALMFMAYEKINKSVVLLLRKTPKAAI